MIGTFIQGGLGNQLFQIAAGLALSWRVGDRFSVVEGQHYLPLQGTRIENYFGNIFRHINVFPQSAFLECKNYSEPHFHYAEIPLERNQYLHGYFQSEKYFADYSNEIREIFSPSGRDIKAVYSLYPFLAEEEVVAVHVRRGDYVNNPDFHPTQGADYYINAVNNLPKGSKILVFSDDIPWCKDNLPDAEYAKKAADYLDLYAMSMCSSHVISNSSFSWWAAWLGNSKNVVAPKLWFGPRGPQDIEDLIPERWEKM